MQAAYEAELTYEVAGDGRPAVVFIHGFLDAASVWSDVASALQGAGIASAAVNLPGMGGVTAKPDEISLDSYAAAVTAMVDAIGGQLVLVGQSMGAQVAELVAGSRPEIVKALVLLTPVPLGGVGAPDEVVGPLRTSGGKADVQRQQRAMFSYDMPADKLDSLVATGLMVQPDVVARLVDVWNGGHELGHLPSKFLGPVLVARGASDPFVDEQMAGIVAERFEHVRLETVNKAGHWAHVERPQEVAELVLDIVKSVGLLGGEQSSASDWRAAFSKKTQSAFGQAFAADVSIEAVTLIKPVHGRENVQRVMEAASQIYGSLTFTDQVTSGSKQYIEWVAEAHEGVKFAGVTVLTRDEAGAIAHIAIHHRPMEAAIFFSKKMGEKLMAVLGSGYFLETEERQRAAS